MKKQTLEEPVNKVHFYVARDKDGVLGLYIGKPFRADHEFEADLLRGVVWLTSHVNYFGLNNEDYKDLKWEDEPVGVFLNLED